jgi:glycosyltransferase involved in cell wall biosynthesis
VYPSLYEGFGIPLLEAMECGCPVICSNSSSIPEVAGDAALYIDPRDAQSISNAMLKVVQSSDERRQMISKGKLRVKQFTWDICAQQTYAIYARILNRQ